MYVDIISNIIFYMPHDFVLQRITISMSTLSKYIREKKHKKQSFLPGGTSARYRCPLPRRRGEGTFVPGRGSTGYKFEGFVLDISIGTNAQPHLYWMVCTGWIPHINVGYQLIQMPCFQLVMADRPQHRHATAAVLCETSDPSSTPLLPSPSRTPVLTSQLLSFPVVASMVLASAPMACVG
jgi:hypothetical protein